MRTHRAPLRSNSPGSVTQRTIPHWAIISIAGIAAGTVATLAELLLWLVLGADLPAVLFRDARLTAAMVMGRGVLPPPDTFDAVVWVVATAVHFVLSVAFAAVIGPLAVRLAGPREVLAGAAFGIALYVVNLYGFTAVFPWFAEARGGVTAAAHIVFGVSAVAVYRFLLLRYGESSPGGR